MEVQNRQHTEMNKPNHQNTCHKTISKDQVGEVILFDCAFYLAWTPQTWLTVSKANASFQFLRRSPGCTNPKLHTSPCILCTLSCPTGCQGGLWKKFDLYLRGKPASLLAPPQILAKDYRRGSRTSLTTTLRGVVIVCPAYISAQCLIKQPYFLS